MNQTDRDLERLGDEIAEAAAHIEAATHALLTKIRRFDELEGWGVHGAVSCVQWLSWRLGLTPTTAREKLRVAHALGSLPIVDEAFRRGELSYSKVRAMTRVASAENEGTLVDLARFATGAQLAKICRRTQQVVRGNDGSRKASAESFFRHYPTESGMVRIEMEVLPDEAELILKSLREARLSWRKQPQETATEDPADDPPADAPAEARPTTAQAMVLLAETFLSQGPNARRGGERNQIFIHLTEESARNPAEPEPHDRVSTPRLHDGTPISAEAFLRLACDSGITPVLADREGNPLNVGRRTRSIPPAIHRALLVRDRGCRFPGCTHQAFVEAHHVKHWAKGGETKLPNLLLLCRFHHTLVHDGGFHIDTSDGTFTFYRPDRRPIENSPVRVTGNAAQHLARQNAATGLDVGPTTLTARDGGAPADYGMAVDDLLPESLRRRRGA